VHAPTTNQAEIRTFVEQVVPDGGESGEGDLIASLEAASAIPWSSNSRRVLIHFAGADFPRDSTRIQELMKDLHSGKVTYDCWINGDPEAASSNMSREEDETGMRAQKLDPQMTMLDTIRSSVPRFQRLR